MKKILSLILASFVLYSCQDAEVVTPESENTQIYNSIIEDDGDASRAGILPVAIEYYQNIAEMAKWYAMHPAVRLQDSLNNTLNQSESFNPLLEKLYDINIEDSTGAELSFFDLDSLNREGFLESFVTLESRDLSEKLEMLGETGTYPLITQPNQAFLDVYNTYADLHNSDESPYFIVSPVLTSIEFADSDVLPSPQIKKQEKLQSATTFWATVINAGLLATTYVSGSPHSLDHNLFVDRIQRSIRKGRILIALPGGTHASRVVHFYTDKDWFDVGHIGIFRKDWWEIYPTVDHNFELTIGATPDYGLHPEQLQAGWTQKHGISFVGKVYDKYWKKTGWLSWSRVSEDVDAHKLFLKANSKLGKPYCNWWEVLTAKWAVPGRFICSSVPYYAAKYQSGTKVNISNWWKTTIFPGGVYLSDRVKIIDHTRY
jgi:hypothetical protein